MSICEINPFSPHYLSLRKKTPQKERKKRILVLAGATGVGKTKISLEIAPLVQGEIISADSMQVYIGMDIGTAKVSKEEQKAIPHHLIDIQEISEEFNVVEFFHRARKACQEIILRHHVPIVVGGSGFYLQAFLFGPPQGPPKDPQLRMRLQEQMEKMGPEVLFERLQILDPLYAETITEKDRHKILRALEIISLTQKPVSVLARPQKLPTEEWNFRCWFLMMHRELLYERVQKRCEEMVQRGFVDEVRSLEAQGLRQNSSASQAIGYRQCLQFLKTQQGEKDKKAFLEAFKRASTHYIKKQFTWFRKQKDLFRWLDLHEVGENRAKEIILQDFEQGD